jgi:uncharacterized protein
MPITALYASLLAFLFILLSFRVIGVRRGEKVELGDGGNRELLRRSRVHANFAEYAPIALVLLGLAESLRTPTWVLHAAGIALLIGRVIHAYGLSQTPHVMPLRVGGMILTFTAILLLAIACLTLSVRGVF